MRRKGPEFEEGERKQNEEEPDQVDYEELEDSEGPLPGYKHFVPGQVTTSAGAGRSLDLFNGLLIAHPVGPREDGERSHGF